MLIKTKARIHIYIFKVLKTTIIVNHNNLMFGIQIF